MAETNRFTTGELLEAHQVLAGRVIALYDAPETDAPWEATYHALGDYALVTDRVAAALRAEIEVTFRVGLRMAGWPSSRAADITYGTYHEPLDPPFLPRLIDDIDQFGHLKPGDVGLEVIHKAPGHVDFDFHVDQLIANVVQREEVSS